MIKDERGYLILAANTETVDYIDCAKACAKSIRIHTPKAKIAILSNVAVDDPVFDHSEIFPFPIDGGFSNDWQCYWGSPFRQTIKIEADMIVPHSIDHWWPMLEHRDVVITTGARNYMNQLTTEQHYRQLFRLNRLPDLYNAITYWRISQTAMDFFSLVRDLFNNWPEVQKQLTMGNTDIGTTDVVYAVAAKLLGVENFTLPNTSYPTLIHMKERINWLQQEDWTKEMVWELNGSNIRIQTIDQQYPFHYHIKEFSKVLNEHYDRELSHRTYYGETTS